MSNQYFEQLTAPPNFTIVGRRSIGRYILGHDQFPVRDDIHITNVFRRDLSNYDDIFLGLLSVIIIAMLSDILFTFLLRNSSRDSQNPPNNTPIPSRLVTAILISEIAHFRFIKKHFDILKSILRHSFDSEYNTSGHRPRHLTIRLVRKIVVILFITGLLFGAEFLSIFATQQVEKFSAIHQYNLRAYQPSATVLGLARTIRRVFRERPCTAPFIVSNSTTQRRNYQLITCFVITAGGRTNEDEHDTAQNVSIESFYHPGGSDHTIRYGEGFVNVTVRVHVIIGVSNGGARRLLFTNIDDEESSSARYIHRLTMHAAADWVCRMHLALYEDWCVLRRQNGEPSLKSSEIRRNILMWTHQNEQVIKVRTGIVSSFENINIPNSTFAFNSGLRWLMSCGYVEEERGPGSYEHITNEDPENGIMGLLSENGRRVGLLAMVVAVIIAGIIKAILHWKLRPFSIGQIVIQRDPRLQYLDVDMQRTTNNEQRPNASNDVHDNSYSNFPN